MSDQSTPGPDPSQPEPPTTPAPVPAPPGWTPPPASATAASNGPRRWWDEATSTGGGRAALAAVAVLAAVFVVVGLGLTTALVVSHRGDDRGFVGMRGEMGNGMGPGTGRGNGQDQGKGQGKGNGRGNGDQRAPGRANPNNPNGPFGPGQGMGGGLDRGAGAALGAVLHGEFTTSLTGTPTVMVVQTGQVTAYTAGKSLTVRSTDGFEATYTLDAATPTLGSGATQLADGVQVRVVAAKEGMKVTALVVGG